jgi:hypothetical protein
MKKLKLSLDDLAVETFRPDAMQVDPGTVLGAESGDCDAAITGWSWLCGTCNGESCGSTCDWNLEATCGRSCGGDDHTLCNHRECQKTTTAVEAS